MLFQARGRVLVAVFAAILLSVAGPSAAAEDSYWHGVRSADWSHGIASGASNWYSLPPPSGVAEQVPNGDSVGGPMAPVVGNTSKLSAEDRAAMAHYVKSLPPVEGPKHP